MFINVDGSFDTRDANGFYNLQVVTNLVLGSNLFGFRGDLESLHIDHHTTPFKAQPYHYLNTIYYFITGQELFKENEEINQGVEFWLGVFERIMDKVILSIAEKEFDIEKSEGVNYSTPRPDGDSVCTLFLQDLLFQSLPNQFIQYVKDSGSVVSTSEFIKWKIKNIAHLRKFVNLIFQVSFWGDNFGFIENDPNFSALDLKELRKISRYLNSLSSNSSDESILKGLTVLDEIYQSEKYVLQGENNSAYESSMQKRQEIINDLVEIIKPEAVYNNVVLIDVSEIEKTKNIKIDAEICQIAFEVVLQNAYDNNNLTRPYVQPVLMIKRNDPNFEYYSLSTFTIHNSQFTIHNTMYLL